MAPQVQTFILIISLISHTSRCDVFPIVDKKSYFLLYFSPGNYFRLTFSFCVEVGKILANMFQFTIFQVAAIGLTLDRWM